MQVKILEWARSLVLLVLPADSTEDPPSPGADPDGGHPGGGDPAGQPEGTEPGAEPGAEGAAAAAEPEPDMVPRAELERVEAEHKARVHAEAEEMLMEVMPEVYPGRSAQPYYGNQPPPTGPGEPEAKWEDMSDEERQNYLRGQNEQVLANQERMANEREADHLINDLEGLKRDHFPLMDVRRCLDVLSHNPGARLDKLAEISHNRGLDSERAMVQDPLFRERNNLPALDPNEPGGTPAPPTAEPGRTAPALPGSGPTTTSAQPITPSNARHIMRDRMRAQGFQG